MKRTLVTVGLVVVIGWVASVIVAWSCALWAPMWASRTLSDDQTVAVLRAHTQAYESPSDPQGIRQSGPGWALTLAVDARVAPPPRPSASGTPRAPARSVTVFNPVPLSPDDRTVQLFTAGWPSMCVTGARRTVGGETGQSGIVSPPRFIEQLNVKPLRMIPFGPRWVGLATNTILYAAVIWLAAPGPFALRRVLRRRRGLCVFCGYNLVHAANATCPECGRS